jgi:hypothetical protein
MHAHNPTVYGIFPSIRLQEQPSQNPEDLTRLRGPVDVSDNEDEAMIRFDPGFQGYKQRLPTF